MSDINSKNQYTISADENTEQANSWDVFFNDWKPSETSDETPRPNDKRLGTWGSFWGKIKEQLDLIKLLKDAFSLVVRKDELVEHGSIENSEIDGIYNTPQAQNAMQDSQGTTTEDVPNVEPVKNTKTIYKIRTYSK